MPNRKNSVFKMIDLFVCIAKDVASGLCFEYNFDEETAGMEFLKLVRKLPRNAQEIC